MAINIFPTLYEKVQEEEEEEEEVGKRGGRKVPSDKKREDILIFN